MVDGQRVMRVLDPAERYFWLLGHFTSVNAVLIAELDRRIPAEDLGRALAALQRRHPLLRARIEVVGSELVFTEGQGEIPLTEAPLREDEAIPVEQMMASAFDPAPSPLARCVYLPIEGRDRSVVVVVVHHAMVDGSAASRLLQQLCRLVDAGDAALEVVPGSVPTPLHDRLPAELRPPRAVVDVLSQIRAERQGQPEPSALPFHAREVTAQIPRDDVLVLDPEAARRLVAETRAAGGTVTGKIAAALLQSTAALFEDGDARTICLAAATDLRQRVEPPLPEDDMMVAIGMLCTPYLVSAETGGTLTRTIGEQISREVARGESHLFYRIARIGGFEPTDAGFASFARWVASTPQNITLSNLGVFDHAQDPPWVRRLTATMCPGPNQLAFVTASTYRGELVLNVATDTAKLAPPLAERLVAGIAARTGARRERDPDEVSV